MCLAHKGKNQYHDSYRGEGSKRGHGRNNLKGRGDRNNHGESSHLHYVCCGEDGHDAKTCWVPWEKIKEK